MSRFHRRKRKQCRNANGFVEQSSMLFDSMLTLLFFCQHSHQAQNRTKICTFGTRMPTNCAAFAFAWTIRIPTKTNRYLSIRVICRAAINIGPWKDRSSNTLRRVVVWLHEQTMQSQHHGNLIF